MRLARSESTTSYSGRPCLSLKGLLLRIAAGRESAERIVLQHSLTSIEQHFHSLHLLLNTKKTKCIIFDRKLDPTSAPKILCADGSELEFVMCYKYLGLWLDSSLSFTTHIKHLQSKVKARLSFLYRNKASFTCSAKHTLVKMSILLIFDYGDTIYRMHLSPPSRNWTLFTIPPSALLLALHSLLTTVTYTIW